MARCCWVTSISCRRFLMSLSVFPCLRMNLRATICKVATSRTGSGFDLTALTSAQPTDYWQKQPHGQQAIALTTSGAKLTWPVYFLRPLYTFPKLPSPTRSMTWYCSTPMAASSSRSPATAEVTRASRRAATSPSLLWERPFTESASSKEHKKVSAQPAEGLSIISMLHGGLQSGLPFSVNCTGGACASRREPYDAPRRIE